MVTIALLPLDERPCNYAFPKRLFDGERVQILRPARLGKRKTPASWEEIRSFLFESAKTADAFVLSIDMLLYGGLLPSRLHHLDGKVLRERLALLGALRAEHPGLAIYAFHCIMRCPDYSSSEEEPDYYEVCGKEIRDLGVALHKAKKGLVTEEAAQLLLKKIPADVLSDYTARRACNLQMNLAALKLVCDGVIDTLVIPQDDCSPYGFSAMDREETEREIARLGLTGRVRTYPGADEAGLTLISRYLNTAARLAPRCYVRYVSRLSETLIPLYEGQPLYQTVEAQLRAAGCTLAEGLAEADFVLALTGPTSDMLESEDQLTRQAANPAERSLADLTAFLQHCIRTGKPVTVGDNAYANGGDLALVKLLNENGLLLAVAGYAGWNTNANTLGTAIAQAVACLHRIGEETRQKFLAERYLEDAGYCAVVRGQAMELAEEAGMQVSDISGAQEELTDFVRNGLMRFLQEDLSSISDAYAPDVTALPWGRLFEVDLTLKKREDQGL